MQDWLQHHPTSPVTQALLPHTRLVPNLLIKGAIASQRQQLSQAAQHWLVFDAATRSSILPSWSEDIVCAFHR